MYLEQAGKAARGNVGQGKQGLPLRQVGRISRQRLTDGHTEVCLPVGPFNDNKHLACLSAHVGEDVALHFTLAAGGEQHTGGQKNPKNTFHVLFNE